MMGQSTQEKYRNNLLDLGLPIVVTLVFLAVVFLFYPFREKIQYDADEGLNLMRSMLVEMDYDLYSEVSSDQPPVLTYLLAGLFRVVGIHVNASRMLILLFSGLLIWSGTQFLQFTWGTLPALFFPFLIFILPYYLKLNVSVMIGVPSIALGMAGMLFLTLWHLGRGSKRRSLWLVLSGVTIALSVMVKLFTGILVPIFLAGVTITAYQEQEKRNFTWMLLRPALIWGFAFGGMVLLILITLVGSTGVPFLIGSHLTARDLSSFQAPRYSINNFLEITMPFLGIIGALFTLQKRRWLTLYPLIWAMSAYLVLSQHTPIWYHHQLLITIPTTILAAMGASESLTWLIGLPRNRDLVSLRGGLSVFGLIAAVLVTTSLLPEAINQLDERPRLTGYVLTGTAPKLAVLNLMNAYAPDTHWVVTDMPMYAIRIQRPVPPDLATFSMKRLLTGDLSEDTVMENMHVYQPEQVLMVRFEIPALETYLQENYRQVYDMEDLRLFIRNDLPEHQPAKQK